MSRYLRAGVVSLILLLTSRVLGLARESVQAFSFGTSAVADVVVVMLTLPDLASAILAGGALSYALLPWWAHQTPADLAASQRSVSRIFLLAGGVLALWILLMPGVVGGWLAPGAAPAMQPRVEAAMRWAALAVPVSLLTLVWYTRLQHERDVVGMYGMNIVHTGVIICAMLAAASIPHGTGWAEQAGQVVTILGVGLVLAFGLRLLFLRLRLRRVAVSGAAQAAPVEPAGQPVRGLPHGSIWLWALLATGAPVAFPLLARSLVSGSGEGALAAFNYAWKLVELPNQLAIQVVATLAFPAFTRAWAQGREFTVQLRAAFMLAWTLACAAALGLWLGAHPAADLLFGWGRMGTGQVAQVAQWSAFGAWTLLPQSLIAVLVLVLATLGRLRAAALAHLAALACLALVGVREGASMMLAMTGALALAAALLMWFAREQAARAAPWREMAVPALACLLIAPFKGWTDGMGPVFALACAAMAAAATLALSVVASPVLRAALKR